MELTLLVEEQGAQEVGGNVRGALWTKVKTQAISNKAWLDRINWTSVKLCRGDFWVPVLFPHRRLWPGADVRVGKEETEKPEFSVLDG